MIAFLTSSPGGFNLENGNWQPCELSSDNHFLDNLKKYWKDHSGCLIISSDPDDIAMNDGVRDLFRTSFSLSGLPFSECRICDARNCNITEAQIAAYDVIILAGGHVPTQNLFFQQIRLKEKLRSFDGIVIGVSAGSMNSADLVYAQPELPGEAADPAYKRFIAGLGITDLMIIPHYYDLKDEKLDGKWIIEDITFGDSKGRRFYLLPDGSYITVTEQETRVYGEAYLVEAGSLKKICEDDNSVRLK